MNHLTKDKRVHSGRVVACVAVLGLAALFWGVYRERPNKLAPEPQDRPKIQTIDPPEDGFFTKVVYLNGIPIKAPSVVVNEALDVAYDRINRETAHLPIVVSNLAAAGAEVHIIGRHQVTTDLPEWRQDKHVPLDEYDGLTRDERTRGMGGLVTSCAEENLLNLLTDRYRGRDICLHEMAHNIEGEGIPPSVRALFDKQYEISKAKGLWIKSYAGSNPDEYFAELTMWYFGTHGDLSMTGPKPENGPDGLRKYDPDAYKLLDDFYSGRIEVVKVQPRPRSAEDEENRRAPRDSLVARGIVAKLTAYKVGETKLSDFFADAGMAGPADSGVNGWHVTETLLTRILRPVRPGGDGQHQYQIFFRNPANLSAVDRLLADLEFKGGVLTAFKWDN
jgi:hypothetical protein